MTDDFEISYYSVNRAYQYVLQEL